MALKPKPGKAGPLLRAYNPVRAEAMSNLKNFIDHTIASGGATYSIFTGEFNPTSGFIVSLYGHESRVPYVPGNVAREVRDYIGKHGATLSADGRFIGAWIDGGDLYLDVSIRVDDENTARQIGQVNQQKAIWDCANRTAITL